MALRNIKITRDIVQTCNKTRAFTKSDLCTVPSQQQPECPENASQYHSVSYSLKCDANYSKNILPELNVTEKNNIASPFTKFIQESQLSTTSTQKGTTFDKNNIEVNTLPFFFPARSYASKKSGKDDDCKPEEKKCIKPGLCPRFKIADCPPMKAKKSECAREYIEPCCTKKMAPYPSYSELCAYRLENDPSECKQCPWQRCGGADAIKPQKKNYHTTTRSMNMTMIPQSPHMAPFLLHKQCDASKEPCKEPPPKCKKQEEAKEKCPSTKKEKGKKKCAVDVLRPEAWTISGSIRKLDLQRAAIGVPSNLAEKIVYDLKDCPKKESEPECPPRKWKYPEIDEKIDEVLLEKLAKEHDKGHPPPCEDKRKPKSEECPLPSKKKKKLYRQQSDLYDPTYRKHPHPYSEQE